MTVKLLTIRKSLEQRSSGGNVFQSDTSMHGFYTSDWKSGEICSSHRGMGAGLGTRQALIKAHWQSCTAVGHKGSTSWTGQTDNWLEGTPIIPKISEETTERIVSVLGCKKKRKFFRAVSIQADGKQYVHVIILRSQVKASFMTHDESPPALR